MSSSLQQSKRIRQNVLSSYVALAQRMATGLFSFRLLYSNLSDEEFGYWALLWSVFGYGTLLDFGFGMTVQKQVAQLSSQGEWARLNRILSTIMVSYLAIAVFVLAMGFLFADAWVGAMGISVESRGEFADLFRIFLGAMALMFPLGLFSEVLRGMQRIALQNVLTIGSSVSSFGCMVWAILTGQPLAVILVFSLAGAILPAVLSAFWAFRLAPELRISPRLFSRREFRGATGFSFVAYFIMISYTIQTKADLLVLSSLMAVSAVALYQPGAKLAELFAMFTKQIAAVLQPAAAALYATGTKRDISNLIVGGIRYSVLLATPAYLGTAFYLEVFLRALTGEESLASETLWVGHALLLWSYSYILTHHVYKQIALMGGHEKRLLYNGMAEAALNLTLSVVAALTFRSVAGVALGTLLPGLLIGWGILWGWAAKESGLTRFGLFRESLAMNWLANLPVLGLLLFLRGLGWTSADSGVERILAGMILTAAVAVGLSWKIALTGADREKVSMKLPWGRKTAR